MIAEINAPISTTVFGLPLRIWKPRPTLPPVKAWMIGLMMSLVNAVIRALNARATTSPTATTIMSPRKRKFLKPLIFLLRFADIRPAGRGARPLPAYSAGTPSRNCVASGFLDMPYDSGSGSAPQAFRPGRARPDLRFSEPVASGARGSKQARGSNGRVALNGEARGRPRPGRRPKRAASRRPRAGRTGRRPGPRARRAGAPAAR